MLVKDAQSSSAPSAENRLKMIKVWKRTGQRNRVQEGTALPRGQKEEQEDLHGA